MQFLSKIESYAPIIDNFNTAYRIIDNSKMHKDAATVAALNKRIAPFEKYFQRYLNAYKQQQEEQAEMMQQEEEMLQDSTSQTKDSVNQ